MKPIAAYALGIDSGPINYSQGFSDYGIGMMLQSELNGRYPALAGQLLDFDDPEVLAHPEPFNQWPRAPRGLWRRQHDGAPCTPAKSRNTVAVRVGQLVGGLYVQLCKDTVGLSHLLLPPTPTTPPIVLGARAAA